MALAPGGLLSPRAAAAAEPTTWSDAASWGGVVPGPNDVATVAGTVVLDASIRVAGLVVEAGGSVIFDPTRSVTLESSGNVVVKGSLTMRPGGAAEHRLVFVGVDEAAIVGGGMDVVASDVGLWVMDDGKLDLQGASKTPWARLAGDGVAGATVLTLDRVPAGWRVGDRIAVVPTTAPARGSDASWAGFSEATLTSVSGSRVTLDTPLAHHHPRVGGTWAAEVLNLTRNVGIEGTPAGRSHVFVRSSQPQGFSFVALRHMGPRKDGAKILGRWPIHFHFSHGSVGTRLDGIVVADAGSHAFVPHESHGMTLSGCIAYHCEEHAFWWDEGEPTDDLVLEGCVAAGVRAGSFGVGGFYLSKGARNVIRDCVGVGADARQGCGIISPAEISNGEWTVERCVSHNNRYAGFKSYLNTNRRDNKVVTGLVAYHNDIGIDHGAYKNNWRYEDFTLYGNRYAGVELAATSQSGGIVFTNGVIDGAGAARYGVVNGRHVNASVYPTVFRSCSFRGNQVAALAVALPDPSVPDLIDLIDCDFEGNELWVVDNAHPDCRIRLSDVTHGTLSARRKDLAGILTPQWNAAVERIAPFA